MEKEETSSRWKYKRDSLISCVFARCHEVMFDEGSSDRAVKNYLV